jgi:hypothetical protein
MRKPAVLSACLLLPFLAQAQYQEISGMAKVEAQQKEEVWCWAAVIQTVASAERVQLNQEAIVRDVKGKLKVQEASFDEITAYFRSGWHGAPGQPGTWTSDVIAFRLSPTSNAQPAPTRFNTTTNVYDGAPPAQMILRFLEVGRPMVLAYANNNGGAHAVVAYGGTFESQGTELTSVKIYDPMTGTADLEDWKFFGKRLIGAWFPTIVRRDGCNVFTAGQPPDPRCQNPVQGTGVPTPKGRVF